MRYFYFVSYRASNNSVGNTEVESGQVITTMDLIQELEMKLRKKLYVDSVSITNFILLREG